MLSAPDACGSLCYEVRVLKVPAGFCEKAGLKLARDTTLTDAQVRALLEAAQGRREASVMQAPRMTALDGQSVTVKVGEERTFVTGIDATKVKGQTAHLPKNTAVHIGLAFTAQGRASADGRYVHVQAAMTQTRLVGEVELTPVVTQITPVFEGGSVGKPVPFTLYLQVPDIRTEQAERTAVVPNGGTLVVGGWKETGEPQGKKPGTEFEVVVLATVRTVDATAVAPIEPPRPLPAVQVQKVVYKLRHVAAADAAHTLNAFLQVKKLTANVIAEPVSNTVYVGADTALQEQIAKALEALDREPAQVVASVVVVQVSRGFAARAGLTGGASTLTPRELTMFNELLRAEKERGTCDVLSRPQIQVCDNQTGSVRVGQEQPVVTGFGFTLVDGTITFGPKVTYVPLGVTLDLTPRVSADGASVKLVTNVRLASMTSGAFRSEELRGEASVAFGHTLVLGASGADHSLTGAVRQLLGGPVETLVVVTPHRVRGEHDGARVLAEEAAKLKDAPRCARPPGGSPSSTPLQL